MYFTLNMRSTAQSEWEPCHQFRWDTPQEATEECKRMNDSNARYNYAARYRVRKVVDTDDDNFYAREAALNHKSVPWKSEASKNYGYPWLLPHIDPDNSRHVRFFRSVEDAVCGKYTSILMSRFLSNYEDFDDDEAAQVLIDAGFYGDMVFGITNDRDKIIDIYTNGPTSCMNDPEEYDLPDPHPAIVYSEGDFAVAYLGNEGCYSSRAVVCKTLKKYYNIYGHNALMESRLKEEGYEYCGSPSAYNGMKVKAIAYDDGYEPWLMPYIDCIGYANLDDNEEFFVFTDDWDNAEWSVRTTHGSPERE